MSSGVDVWRRIACTAFSTQPHTKLMSKFRICGNHLFTHSSVQLPCQTISYFISISMKPEICFHEQMRRTRCSFLGNVRHWLSSPTVAAPTHGRTRIALGTYRRRRLRNLHLHLGATFQKSHINKHENKMSACRTDASKNIIIRNL